jgi:serine/threonine protein kinase
MVDDMRLNLLRVWTRYHFTHGDLKPDNFMYDNDNNMRIIDLGFSRMKLRHCDTKVFSINQTVDVNDIAIEGRDLVQLSYVLYHHYGNYTPTMATAAGSYKRSTKTILEYILKMKDAHGATICNLAEDEANCDGFDVNLYYNGWGSLYSVVNSKKNYNASFDNVKAKGEGLFAHPLFRRNPPEIDPRPCEVAHGGGDRSHRKKDSRRIVFHDIDSRQDSNDTIIKGVGVSQLVVITQQGGRSSLKSRSIRKTIRKRSNISSRIRKSPYTYSPKYTRKESLQSRNRISNKDSDIARVYTKQE